MLNHDIVIIGAGVSGSAIARELSRYDLDIVVLEKQEDICSGTSKANSGIIHAGYDAPEGSLMASLNVEGNAMMDSWSEELDIPFQRIGSLVVCLEEEGMPYLEKLYQRGIKNGVPHLEIIDHQRLKQLEPHIAQDAVGALYAPSAGIVCPFELNLAMAENAVQNGVRFLFDTEVLSIDKIDQGFCVLTSKGKVLTKHVINAAGVHADTIHNMVSMEKMEIIPRKGEYVLLDKKAGKHVRHTIFQLPTKMGKGVLVTPTIHGNLLVGPTSEDVLDKEALNTTEKGLRDVIEKAQKTVQDLPMHMIITSFAGLRAHRPAHEFIIEEVKDVPGFIDVAGIESPGLSSCPAIGKKVAKWFQEKYDLVQKSDFQPRRKGLNHLYAMNSHQKNALIQKDSRYGNIVCRCEMISEGEIVEAIHRPIPARSLDGIKRRVRAGMGRCQGGFCLPKVVEILAREQDGKTAKEITKSGKNSYFIVGNNKEDLL